MNYQKYRIKNYFQVLSILIILSLYSPISAQQMSGWIAPTFLESNLSLSDGAISNEWPQVKSYVNLTEFGSGGFMKFSHNTTHIFALIGTTEDQWVAIEFEPDEDTCMRTGHDLWIFYINRGDESIEAVDATMDGISAPIIDEQNDLYTEATFVDDFLYIEIVRKFDTFDTTSNDVSFTNGTELVITVASEATHLNNPTPYYLAIFFSTEPDPYVPDFNWGSDWDEKKDFLIVFALIFAGIFMMTHIIMRVILYPLEHPNQIIDSTKIKSPTFKERWRSLKQNKPLTSENIISMEETDV